MANYQLIAATGCPTGIAHTYMAQEALEQAAKKKGITIKVETHGQIGVENELTTEEIAGADAVIIASDKDVNAERFAGKRVIDVSVGRGIKEADKLIQDALDGKGKVMGGTTKSVNGSTENSGTDQSDRGSSASIGRQIYKHLMNGVSHMLPFVVSGGVLVAISFLFGIYSADPTSDQYSQIAATLKDVGGTAMGLMVPVLSAYIAESIAKRPGLVAGFVGGMIALSGGTGFLGGIVSGFLAGFVVLLLSKMLKGMPHSLEGLKAIFILPVLGVLITGVGMVLLSQPMEAINNGMMDFLAGFQDSNPIVLGLIVGCMCAFDMGGQ
ncbi:PTS fructose transporter subunit IIC [Jeotgalibaca sp. MA1X17-3]|uniref:PTS fructose transporter subunit IIC n=1 Tax=Jeotgalibaca sp. MA1X17-3 TaxID=2908211 RepID=UPI0037C02D35